MQNFHNFSGTILQKSAIKNTISRFFFTFYKYRDGTPSKKLWFALSTTTPKSLLELRSQKSLLESRSMVHAGITTINVYLYSWVHEFEKVPDWILKSYWIFTDASHFCETETISSRLYCVSPWLWKSEEKVFVLEDVFCHEQFCSAIWL